MVGWVARGGRRVDGKERGRRIPAVGCNDRSTQPAASSLDPSFEALVQRLAVVPRHQEKGRRGFRGY
jgi:hypothetical protein